MELLNEWGLYIISVIIGGLLSQITPCIQSMMDKRNEKQKEYREETRESIKKIDIVLKELYELEKKFDLLNVEGSKEGSILNNFKFDVINEFYGKNMEKLNDIMISIFYKYKDTHNNDINKQIYKTLNKALEFGYLIRSMMQLEELIPMAKLLSNNEREIIERDVEGMVMHYSYDGTDAEIEKILDELKINLEDKKNKLYKKLK